MSVEKLRGLFSADNRPILWLGAGASCQADPPLPTLWGLVDALRRQESDNWQPPESDDPYVWIDDFVRELGEGELHRFLEREFRKQGRTPQPGPLHLHLAKLIAAGRFKAIIDTCYDLLLRRALERVGAPHRFSQLDRGLHLANDGLPLYLALHGTWDDWTSAVLTGESYATYDDRHPLAIHELEVLLRQNRVLFVGCSLQDPRLLRWFAELPAERRRLLHMWRALIGPGEDARLHALKWTDGRSYAEVLRHIQRIELPDFTSLPRWFETLANEVVDAQDRALAVTIVPGPRWTIEALGERIEREPPEFDARELAELQVGVALPLGCNKQGELDDASRARAAALVIRARAIGEALFELLPNKARTQLAELIGSAAMSEPATLQLRVDGEPAAADAVLVLAWELLCVRGEFPVGNGSLNLVREVVVPGAVGLPEDSTVPRIIAHVAAPDRSDAPAQELEAASFRIARALDPLRDYVRFTELGTLDDLVEAVRVLERPTILHFSGRGAPGQLIFEDEDGSPAPIEIASVCDRLAAAAMRLPAAFWLSCGHGASVTASNSATYSAGEPSIAAQLHRRGIPQVLGYFGPIPDPLIAKIDRTLFEELVATERTVEAVRRARLSSKEVLDTPSGYFRFPFAWSLLALYHRGPDRDLIAGTLQRTKRLEDVLRPERIELAGAEGIPVLEQGFIGRRRLLARLRKLRKRGERSLGLYGLGGLGKTTTMTRFAIVCTGAHQTARDVIALPFGDYVDGDSNAGAFNWLLGLVKRVIDKHPRRPRDWQQLLEQVDVAESRPQALARVLLGLARGGVLYLDNLESMQASAEVSGRGVAWRDPALEQFFASLTGEVEGDTTILMTSRYLPAGACGCWEPIDVCSKAEIYRMTAWRHPLARLPESLRVQLTERIDGHPGTVDWINALMLVCQRPGGPPLDEKGDVEQMRIHYLDPALDGLGAKVEQRLALRRLLAQLEDHELALLGECTAIRRPVPLAIVEQLGVGVERLLALGLLARFGEDAWAVHSLVGDAVPEHFGERVPWTRAGRTLLGDYREERGFAEHDFAGMQEALAHHVAAEQWPAAERTMIALSAAMHQGGLYRLRHEFLAGLAAVAWPPAQADAWHHHAGAAARTLGKFSEAEAHARESVALAQHEHEGQVHADVVSSSTGLANVLFNQGKFIEAESAFRDALALEERRVDSHEHMTIGVILSGLGCALLRQANKLTEAEQCLREAVGIIERVMDDKASQELVLTRLHLESLLILRGRYGEAETSLRATLTMARNLPTIGVHPVTLEVLRRLADALDGQGRYAEAVEVLEQCVPIAEAMFGTRASPMLATILHALGNSSRGLGRYEQATVAYQEAMTILDELHGDRDHPDRVAALTGMAVALTHLGRYEAAEQAFRGSIAIGERSAPIHGQTELVGARHGLANLLAVQGRAAEAEVLFRENIAAIEALHGRQHPDIASMLHGLASVVSLRGGLEEAEALFRESLALKRGHLRDCDDPEIRMSMEGLANVLVHEGKIEAAHAILIEFIAAEQRSLGSLETSSTRPSLVLLAEVELFARNQPSEALRWARVAWDAGKRSGTPVDLVAAGPGYVGSLFRTGQVLAGSEALQQLNEALRQLAEDDPVRSTVEAKLARMFASPGASPA